MECLLDAWLPSCVYGFSLTRCKLSHPTHITIIILICAHTTSTSHIHHHIHPPHLISRLRRPFFHHHIPSYNIHRFRPSSTAGKRKEYHFFPIIRLPHHNRFTLAFIIYLSIIFSITMDFIHWLHRERGLELSIFSSNKQHSGWCGCIARRGSNPIGLSHGFGD